MDWIVYKDCLIQVDNEYGFAEYGIIDLKNGSEIMSGTSTDRAPNVIKELKEQIRIYREDPQEFLTTRRMNDGGDYN